MRYRQYKFKFYLNASHSICIQGMGGERHPHTWEIGINIICQKQGFIQFSDVEEKIEAWVSKYQDTYLNEIEPFNEMNPTLENCCDYFKDRIQEILGEDWKLMVIEMSETPTRSYIVNLFEEEFLSLEKYNSEVVVDHILAKIRQKKNGE